MKVSTARSDLNVKLGLSYVNHEIKHKLNMDLWMLIMDASNFTLYSLSIILESSLVFAKHLLYQNFS